MLSVYTGLAFTKFPVPAEEKQEQQTSGHRQGWEGLVCTPVSPRDLGLGKPWGKSLQSCD